MQHGLSHLITAAPPLAVLLAFALAAPALADDELAANDKKKKGAEYPSTITLQVENDLFGDGLDQNYTNGVQLTFAAGDQWVPDWYKDLLNRIPGIDEGDSKRFVVAIGQQMFTPEDTTRISPDPNDRPYAGWGFVSFGAVVEEKDTDLVQNVSLDLGFVGPPSLAGYTQRRYHTLIGVDVPRGWGKQLHTEPGLMLSYQARLRQPILEDDSLIELDVMPTAGVTLGNILTQGTVGAALRFGQNLDLTYGPAFIRPSLPAAAMVRRRNEFGWNLFAGIEGRAVAHNIFLDGNTFGDSRSVDKKNFVLDLQGGVEFVFGVARLSFTQILRSREFDGEKRPSQFGSIALSAVF